MSLSSLVTDAFAVAHILAPSVHARLPLVHRMGALKIPVTFVYGNHDWMDPSGGEASIKAMRTAGNKEGRIYLVPGAGHHGTWLKYPLHLLHSLTLVLRSLFG